MIAFDLTHTSHSGALTGIQKVCRSLFRAVAAREDVQPVCYDPYGCRWRRLYPNERECLFPQGEHKPGKGRKAFWTSTQKWRGRLHSLLPPVGKSSPFSATGLIVPEFFSARTAAEYPRLFTRIDGPKVALFYDSIALKLPEFSPRKTVARFPRYLQELLQFDGIAAISEASRSDLLGYWDWLGVPNHPPVVALPLACDFTTGAKTATAVDRNDVFGQEGNLIVLCVSTIEGRKNHRILLRAAEALWKQGIAFELEVIGMVNRETGTAVVEEMNRLAARYPLKWRGTVSEEELAEAYRRCTLTVYPSLMEGFGLPVLESLRFGKACLCSGTGALGEVAREGGCLLCDVASEASMRESLHRLLSDKAYRIQMEEQAQAREFKTWEKYSHELTTWMQTLPAKSPDRPAPGKFP